MQTGGAEVRNGTCPVCNMGCHVKVHIQDSKVVKVAGDMESPSGHVCERVAAAVDFHYHPGRVNYPLKRAGERGEGKWKQISWAQALDEIAKKLSAIRSEYGPEAVAVHGGGGASHSDPAAWKWCNLWGTPNYFYQGKNCGQAEFLAECAIYGYLSTSGMTASPVPGVTRCAIIWGANYWATFHHTWEGYLNAQKAGAKLIVVDPRPTESAKAADIWVRLRPGTDGALALGMMNVMINEGLYDREFVEKWCVGFDRLRALVQQYPPEKVAAITWVPERQVVEVARLYGTNKPGLITGGLGPRHSGAGAGLSGVVGKCLLRAISGNLDVEGGQRFMTNPEKTAYLEELHLDKLLNHPLRTRDNVSAHVWPMASLKALAMFREAQGKVFPRGAGISTYFLYPSSYYLWSAILEQDPYPIKAIISKGNNSLVVLGNARRIHQAMKSPNLELSVVQEYFMTPSTQLADYVLPAADNLERPYVDSASTWGFCDMRHTREQAVEPLFERRDDWYTWRDLGMRLGQEEFWPETPVQWADRILRPTGKTFKDLTKIQNFTAQGRPEYKTYRQKGFATFSGKVEISSSFFEKIGVPSLSDYHEPPWSPVSTPELARDYPLVLTTGGRHRSFWHSQHRQIEKLRKKHPSPLLQIHPSTAQELGISEGDTVYVETPLGRIRQTASLVDGLDPRVVNADTFWWFPEMPANEPCLSGVWESNINAILPDGPEVCDYAGNNYFRGLLCRVYKG